MTEFNGLVDAGVELALLTMVLLLLPLAYRVFAGPEPVDRLQAIDAINILLIGIIVLLVPAQGEPFLMNIGIALAAFSFVATVAISRYLCEGKVF